MELGIQAAAAGNGQVRSRPSKSLEIKSKREKAIRDSASVTLTSSYLESWRKVRANKSREHKNH